MNTPTAGRWAIAAAVIALAYLIGAGGWSTPTTAVGTVAHASSERAEPMRVVVEVAAPQVAAVRPDTTELAALLAAEDELAERSATVVARATERAERKAATPAKVTPVKATAKPASATTPAKAEQKAAKAAEKAQQKAAAKAEKAEQKATAKAAEAEQKAAAKAAEAKRKAAVKAAEKAATEAGGQVYGAPITDAAWSQLQASGWQGDAGDSAEALYHP